MRIWRLIGHYDATTTTYSACAGGKATSPFRPDFSGALVGLRTINASGAATTLTNHVQFKLTCTSFKPNVLEVGAQGAGLMTAPAVSTGPVIDWSVNQPIVAGVDVTVEGRNEAGAETPVTPEVMLYGCFEVK